MAQLINLTSEALQATVRRLLPSQQGFGEDLQATNVVTPIIDLTPTAEGSVLPSQLQNAWDFATTFSSVAGATTTLITTPGFWKVDLEVAYNIGDAAANCPQVYITDGLAIKKIYQAAGQGTGTEQNTVSSEIFYVFLRAGDSLVGKSNFSTHTLNIWYRQVATANGTLVNPTGFEFQ